MSSPGETRPPALTPAPPANQEWTIGALLDWTARFLAKRGSEYPRLDTEVLLAHALGCRRIELYTRYDEPTPAEARERFRELVRRRVEGCPVAYLVGRKEFFALEFEVNPAVLIPRPESEFVVMECLRLARGMERPRVLDLGTGSGNIIVAVTQRHAGVQGTTVEVSPEAVAVAQRNAAKHGVAGRIRFLTGDLFEPIPPGERFDFLLSNPPYIAREDLAGLPVGVRDYEPRLALDGGPGGYVVLERILARAGDYLEPGGYLIVEIGAPQAEPVRQRLAAHPGFRLEETLQDYSGHPRVLRVRKN
ncbi:MAG: peptide chain release factor N(5)-glutamine methyltransferase [Planctomycetes bacterium]|nr:peptide chain release factor N(5)-glutamine methyltransferase [Planctomycetota bacterium]